MILRDYECTPCGRRFELLEERDAVLTEHFCSACGGAAFYVISPPHVKIPCFSGATTGKSDPPPPGAFDTRPIAEGQSIREWRADRRKFHEGHRRNKIRSMVS